MKQVRIIFFFALSVMIISCQNQPEITVLDAPAGTRFTKIDTAGVTVIPNGRLVTPVGKSITVAPHPFGLILGNDGDLAVTANSGTRPLSVSVISNLLSGNPEVMQIPPGPLTDKGVIASVYMGLALSPQNDTLYVSGGEENGIYLFNTGTGEKLGFISCNKTVLGQEVKDGYIGDMVLSKNGKWLYAVDQIQFRMLVVNTQTLEVVRSVKTGRYPFGIALSPDQHKVYVANVGMFEYKPIEMKNKNQRGIAFPPFGYNTEKAKYGFRNDSVKVYGLGDPNVPESFSVWAVDVSNPESAHVVSKVKTGHLVGEPVEGIPAVGGSSPNSIVATDQYVFVSNGNNDNISVIDIKADTIITEIYLKPDPAVEHFRGVIPFGVAVSPDQQRLYVAESGINAVGVIDIPSFKVMGHIPAGWFPSKLKVTPDGKKLVVANAKGYGSGPNGGRDFTPGQEGTYIGSLMKGTVQVLDIPPDDSLNTLTRQVIANNFHISAAGGEEHEWRKNNPVPLYGGQKESPVKHIVFISKENRTYDEIFGQLENADGDPTLARYGKGVSFKNHAGTDSVTDATVMPNHLKLAGEFAFADNFYVDSDVSADGHRWLVNTYPNEWVEVNTSASYGGNRYYKSDSDAPGIYAMTGSAGAIYPEDYNEAGSLWDHLQRNGIGFFNFGFGIMFEPAVYHESFKYTGVRHLVNFPVPQPMYDKTSKIYPTYNTSIPDQFRVDQFIKEFGEKWINGADTMPALLTVIIPNDHGAWERPDDGYPFRESYMADNDLAVGRIVEFLSGTPYWKNMLIVITEDDAQNGVDHVDAHRSVLLVISPWVKRNYAGHQHYSFGSIFKTFWNILGLPYLNQFDAGATDLADLFTDVPDTTVYHAVPVDPRIFDPQKALDPLDEEFNWKALEESPVIDNPEDMLKMSKEKEEYRLEDRERK